MLEDHVHVNAVFLIPDIAEKLIREFGGIDVADDDIQIGVLGVVQIVDLAALYQLVFLAELRDVSGLGVYQL